MGFRKFNKCGSALNLMKWVIFVFGVFFISLFFVGGVSAADHYVRQGASGSGNDWSNAYGSLPSTLIRGDTYYIADGVYGSYNFNTAVSGSQYITIKKATGADHGTNTGWVSGYGDGQATFSSPIQFTTSYWLFDGAVWEGFRINSNSVIGGCPACGAMRISGSSVTIKNTFINGDYSGGFGHSVGLAGRDTTFERCHFYKTYQEDHFGGEPTGTLTIRESVIEMPDVPNDGVHRDVFNPETGSGNWNLVLENNIFNNIWLFSFLMQESSQMGDITVRGNVFANGGAHVIRFGSGNGGVRSATFDHNVFYNIIDYAGSNSVHTNNIYARSSSWTDVWGGTDVHQSGPTSNCLTLVNPTDFANVNDPLGPDGIPRTSDDGFRITNPNSNAIGAASDGSDIGAYDYSVAVPQTCSSQNFYCCPEGSTCSVTRTGTGCAGTCCLSQSYCQPILPTCFDGSMNGDETGVDCGGVCPACPSVCGDSQVGSGEDCDDGNTVTESCAYGVDTSCVVCDSGCHNASGVLSWCGDGVCDSVFEDVGSCYDDCYVEPGNGENCLVSINGFQNQAFSSQANSFTVNFEVTPNANSVDAVSGLSEGLVNDYSDMAVIVRFNDLGQIDVRNGGYYEADSSVNYVSGQTYNIKIDVDTSGSYDVFVDGTLIANDYLFRSEQTGVLEFNYLGYRSEIGTHDICNFEILGDCTSVHESDTDCVAGVSLDEMTAYFDLWLSGEKTIRDLMAAVRIWKG